MKKFISLLLAAVMVLGCFGFVFADDAADGLVIAPAPTAAASNDIVIMHTNDVHCGYLPYDKLATLAKDADLLVDAGDAIQGDVIGTLSKGEYINEIMVGGEPLDVNKTYKLASHNYMLKSCGDGYAMFGTNNVKLLLDETVIDNQVLINYIVDSLGGVVGEEYAQPQGRITIIDKAFTDVSEKDWFQGAAIYAKENKLFAGYPDGSFKGKNTMTMKELAAVLYNVAGAQEETVEGAWYATQQAWMEKNAIVDTFEADATVTREDFITMFVKTLALKGTDTAATEEMKAALEKAVDYADIAEENADAIAWAVNAGLISGTSTDALTISPATEMNRATVAAMLKNYYTKAEAPLAGGWTAAADGTVTEELKAYFEKATKALMGAKYTPVKLLGTQVVAGTNYKVLCEKTTVTAEPTTTTVTVVLYVDLEGNCTITSIE